MTDVLSAAVAAAVQDAPVKTAQLHRFNSSLIV